MLELKSSSTPYRGKSTAEQYMNKSSKKYSEREEQVERY